jgi:nicotinamidase-related amidase
LHEQLVDTKRDTLIITGCSITSCVHATAQDSIDLGFHTILPIEAVGDRNPGLAKWMLIDIDLKLGDVVPSAEVVDYLQRFS